MLDNQHLEQLALKGSELQFYAQRLLFSDEIHWDDVSELDVVVEQAKVLVEFLWREV